MRIQITLQYKGTNYIGWQTQNVAVSVQQVLEKTLGKILNQKIHVAGSGRTDSGVHAFWQTAHFDLPDDCKIPLHKIHHGLTSLLPPDIGIISLKQVNEKFHAQFDVKKKTYRYLIFNSWIPSPFLDDMAWRIPYALDVAKMKKAAAMLKGEHDFSAFCAADSTAKSKVRRIFSVTIKTQKDFLFFHFERIKKQKIDYLKNKPCQLIVMDVCGKGFLKQMVRTIAGSLVDVGKGKMTLIEFKALLKHGDRKKAGRTAPAKGLGVMGVGYR
ncbi:tRNA pseudouridine(38-40) synthase TruA [bacterium]|nr:tRNA pseudouridine(38-40) synthase TruA [bacterium]